MREKSKAVQKWLLKAASKEQNPYLQVELICQALGTSESVRRAIMDVYKVEE